MVSDGPQVQPAGGKWKERNLTGELQRERTWFGCCGDDTALIQPDFEEADRLLCINKEPSETSVYKKHVETLSKGKKNTQWC